jgi:hypothetical protein
MRTVSLQSVLNGVYARMGMDITGTIPAHTVAAYVEYVNAALREGWERYPWPWAVLVEQREYRATYSNSTAYAIGDEVFYSGSYYRATAAGTGNLPTDTNFWGVATDLVKTISLDQVGETPIGEVLGVYATNPRIREGTNQYKFSLVDAGVLVTYGPLQPWVMFTTRPPVYTVNDGALTTFPYALSEFVKLKAAADAQREDGQFDKAAALEAGAMAKLDQELDTIELKQGQQRRWSPY